MDTKFSCELNDLVLKKLLSLGTNHKNEFKAVLNKWPQIKTKIENAFKMSSSSSSSDSKTTAYYSNVVSTGPANQFQFNNTNSSSTPGPSSKAPKIQLKNFANFK